MLSSEQFSMEVNKTKIVDTVKCAANLDEALTIAGMGWYNLKYCLIMGLILIATLMDLLGNSLVLPAAVCDLQMNDTQRGIVISIPYIGILLTSYPWGYLVDTRGRKSMLVYSALGAGVFSIIASFMPDLISYAIFKSLSALCFACLSSAPYAYIGEMLPPSSRDIVLSVLNSAQIAGSALVPLFAWAILPLDFRIPFGIYVFRPWRLLSIMYSVWFIVFAIILSYSPESPKYLVSQDKFDEALKILQNIYAGNKGKKPEDFPIKQLIAPPNDRQTGYMSLVVQTVPLLKWIYLKWILLNGFMLFGIYLMTNGLNMWVPDVLNRVITSDVANKTACQVIQDRLQHKTTEVTDCNDKMDEVVIIIIFVARLSCAFVAAILSATVKYIGKKRLVIISFLYLGSASIVINFITKDIVFAILLSTTSIIVMTIGPINAYAVELFPTHLRGMAVSLSMMLGRIGSVVGANGTGVLINTACEGMFYGFGGLLMLCSAAAFLLPASDASKKKKQPAKTNIIL